MYAANGHFRPFATYHCPQGENLRSISIPKSFVESITGATVLEQSGPTLQHAKVQRPLDHDPTLVKFANAPDIFRPPPHVRPRLDMNILGSAMKTGYRREDFIRKVDTGAKEAASRHPPHSSMADQKWDVVVQILQQAADDCYAQGLRREQVDGCKELVTAREATLRKKTRGQGETLRSWVSTKKKEQKSGEKPKRSKRQLKRARRRWSKLKRATLEEELVDAEHTGSHGGGAQSLQAPLWQIRAKNWALRCVTRLQTARQWQGEQQADGP